MPGPPPPSQSYLLKIVDSSDEEDEDDEVLEEEVFQYDAVTMDERLSASTAEVPVVATATPSPKRKRKKKKKKKKKGGAGKQQQEADATCTTSSPTQDVAMADSPKKAVAFGTVSVHSFERVLGTDVVPYDGGWPLGLGTTEIGEVESTEVEAYETAKQERLRIRAKELGVVEEESSNDSGAADVVLETRQWDYKYKSKNPLFHLLQEERRMNLLLQSSTPEDELDGSKSAMNSSCSSSSSPSSSSKRRDSKGTPDSKSKKRRDSKNKHSHNNNGSNGKHNSHGNGSNNNHHPMATRSSHSKRERSGSFSSTSERYNDTFTQVKVHHVRNELEELRFQRSGEGHTGCTCRKLDVYLLPPNAGKKAHHRRMNVKRVKDELKKRHLLPSSQKTREELELLLHDAVEKEACCSSHDCPCVRNGIECQADVCACWHDSHQCKDNHNNTNGRCSLPVETIQARCGNANGMYAVDLHAIQSFREELLAKVVDRKNNSDAGDGNDDAHVDCFICPPVSVHTPIPPQQQA